MTIASGEINLQKHNLTSHVAQVKAATSAHSMADVIPFFSELNIPFESNASKKPKEKYLLFTTKKTLSVTFPVHHCSNSFWRISIPGCVIQSRSWFGRAEVWVWSPTKQRKINPVQSKNRARPMAARLKNPGFVVKLTAASVGGVFGMFIWPHTPCPTHAVNVNTR